MDSFRVYAVPLKSLRNGIHRFNWTLDSSFFEHFEASPIRKGVFKVSMELDKQDDLSSFQLNIEGSYKSVCDRCLANIEIPVNQQYQLYVKTSLEVVSDPSLICLSPGEVELKMAGIFYDYICLSLPITQTINCGQMESPPCDKDILSRIQSADDFQSEETVWDALKKLKEN
ncbi:MAG: hypothetical protein IPM92_11375 [Saprospiraceae bacterium]|nr:hypothetical protein [Saprospiraceae bacterium]